VKILFLDQFCEMGGAQRCLMDLVAGAGAAGWQGHVALPGEGPLARLAGERGTPVHPLSLEPYSLGRKSLVEGIGYLLALPRLAREIGDLGSRLGVSLLYVNGPRLLPAVALARTGLPVIFHAHNQVSFRNGAGLVAIAARNTNARVIASSRFLAAEWERRLGPGRVRVIYAGVEGPGGAREPRRASAGPRIGMIARIGPQKRQKEFVQAAAELAGEWPEAQFYLCGDVLFGDWRGERYKNEVLALAPPSLRYLGWRQDVNGLLSTLDLLLLPSTSEGGIPRVILEAFAARVPVLAYPAGATAEGIVEGQTGFLLSASSAAVIARRVGELLRAPDRLAAAAERAHRLWQEKFTVERYRNQVWEEVASVASESRRRKTPQASSPSAAVDSRTAV